MLTLTPSDRPRFERELRGNILPFWLTRPVDRANGGYYGALSNGLEMVAEVGRSAALCSGILWTFSAAGRAFGDPAYLDAARYAHDTLCRAFWDTGYGGLYQSVEASGRPLDERKRIATQGAAITGLVEYHRATGDSESLALVQTLFRLVEKHSSDPVHGGNIDAVARDWTPIADSDGDRFSVRGIERGLRCHKSTATLLRLLDGYTALFRVWPTPDVAAKLRGLVEIFFARVSQPRSHHFKLHFDEAWNVLSDETSFGHDIEGSWLLVEAADALGDAGLVAAARSLAVGIAETICAEGRDTDGSIFYEAHAERPASRDKHAWVQAEAVVGLYNAYHISGRPHLLEAARMAWDVIENRFADRVNGDWFKVLHRSGEPLSEHPKIGPAATPYHQARACLEMMRRLGERP